MSHYYNVLYKKLYIEKGQKLVRFRGARNILNEIKNIQAQNWINFSNAMSFLEIVVVERSTGFFLILDMLTHSL